MLGKKRIYQVAKEFHISNETLIDFLHKHNHKAANIMALVGDDAYDLVQHHFVKVEPEVEKESDFRKKIAEKKEEAEARRRAIMHEIDEILEMSKAPISTIPEKQKREKVTPPKAKPEKTEEPKIEKISLEEPTTVAPVKAEISPPPTIVTKPVETSPVLDKIDLRPSKPVVRGPVSQEKPKRHLKKEIRLQQKRGGDASGEFKSPVVAGRGGRDWKKFKKMKHVDLTVPRTEEGIEAVSSRKKRRKKKKAVIKIDEKEITASIRSTLAKMGDTTKKKKRRKEKESEEFVEEEDNFIKTTELASVSELANLMEVETSEVIKACMSLGLMVSRNQRLDREAILMVADEFGFDVRFQTEYGEERAEEARSEEEDDPTLLESRPPVVTIMGHVDHGKTSLLDFIRESNIIAGEAGGITQHIGAYEVAVRNKRITFLDTPGHQAFTAMRARGAQSTDIVVLVVAADDQVMPQTVEAINHARAAGVPMVVAINKMDKPGADPERIKKQLSEQNILVEDWGGKVQYAMISAKTGDGIDRLLEKIILEADILELKANPHTRARGVMIEVRLDKGKGIVGTVLVQKGTLRIGDSFIAGPYYGRVRAMFNERDQIIHEAPPSAPVQVLGFTGPPQAGDIFNVLDSEQEAREIGLKRQQLKREQTFRQIKRITLDQISKQIAEGVVKELSIIIKADVDGSVGALTDSLTALGNSDVAIRIIHKGVGTITESDVLLAEASQAVIIGFHVSPNIQAKELAMREKVDIRIYKIIYDVINDIKLALSGLLEPEYTEEVIGTVEVREMFRASKVGLIAGCFVTTGKIVRNSHVRVLRDKKMVYEGRISTLKRFKDDAKEVTTGYECGLTLSDYEDLQVGDILEVYQIVETARML